MTNLPYMPLYVADLMADTTDLTPEEFGVYMRLLINMWRGDMCSIPNDDVVIARMVGCSTRRWRQIRGKLGGKLTIVQREDVNQTAKNGSERGNYLTQKRSLLEWNKAMGKREQRVLAGRKSARKRWGTMP